MPVHLRALVVILILAGAVFILARRPAGFAVADDDFRRRRNLWFAVTLIAFLAHNFWIFLAVTGLLLAFAGRREHSPIALFIWLLFAVPPFSTSLSGFGILNQLLVVSYPRLLSLVLLLPAFIVLRRQAQHESKSGYWPDFLVAGYVAVQLILQFSVDSATNTARFALYAVLDVGLPYYVASRSLRKVEAYRDVAMSFSVLCILIGLIGMFESIRAWLLYASLDSVLNMNWGLGNYLGRGGELRAQATTGHPIVLGYLMVVALGFYAYLARCVSSRLFWWLGFAVLLGGLIATYSRGPWIAGVVALVVFRLSGPKALGGMFKAMLMVGAVGGLLLVSPLGHKIIDLLPFVGSIETENIDYRQRLLMVSIDVILKNPWFGSFSYRQALVDQDLVIGGMVDVVNSYLGIGLANGLVGLVFFVASFLYVMSAIWMSMRRLPDTSAEIHTVGSGLLACLAGIMVTIFTVSSISLVPVVYWTMLGLGMGYVVTVRRYLQSAGSSQGVVGATPQRAFFPQRAG